jgi:hypothetical protein
MRVFILAVAVFLVVPHLAGPADPHRERSRQPPKSLLYVITLVSVPLYPATAPGKTMHAPGLLDVAHFPAIEGYFEVRIHVDFLGSEIDHALGLS